MLRVPHSESKTDRRKRYAEVVKQVLEEFVGTEGARSVLFYTGEPDPDSFEENLRKEFGAGTALIMKEISQRLDKST
jgi:hypothetical protein